MSEIYTISIENLYNQNKFVLDNGYFVKHTAIDDDSRNLYEDYYDLYALNNEMVCSDGEECDLIKKDKKGYHLHSINVLILIAFLFLPKKSLVLLQ